MATCNGVGSTPIWNNWAQQAACATNPTWNQPWNQQCNQAPNDSIDCQGDDDSDCDGGGHIGNLLNTIGGCGQDNSCNPQPDQCHQPPCQEPPQPWQPPSCEPPPDRCHQPPCQPPPDHCHQPPPCEPPPCQPPPCEPPPCQSPAPPPPTCQQPAPTPAPAPAPQPAPPAPPPAPSAPKPHPGKHFHAKVWGDPHNDINGHNKGKWKSNQELFVNKRNGDETLLSSKKKDTPVDSVRDGNEKDGNLSGVHKNAQVEEISNGHVRDIGTAGKLGLTHGTNHGQKLHNGQTWSDNGEKVKLNGTTVNISGQS